MGNIQNIGFDKEELKSIFDDAFNKESNIYAVSTGGSGLGFLPGIYTVYCKKLPQGIYKAHGKRIKLHGTSRIIWEWSGDRSFIPHYAGKDAFGFEVIGDSKQIMLKAKYYTAKQISDIVFDLRKQAAINSKTVENTLSR